MDSFGRNWQVHSSVFRLSLVWNCEKCGKRRTNLFLTKVERNEQNNNMNEFYYIKKTYNKGHIGFRDCSQSSLYRFSKKKNKQVLWVKAIF